MLNKDEKRIRRHKRLRAKISGTKERPRLCVFKSHSHIYAQLIDDIQGKTMAAVRSAMNKKIAKATEESAYSNKAALAFEVGKLIAQKAHDLKISTVVFDRGGYQYHGRVKALAQGAREAGLKF